MKKEWKTDAEKKFRKEKKTDREITPEEMEKVSGGASRYQHRRPVR